MKPDRTGSFRIRQNVDWEALIHRGIESDELDYKAAQDWSKLSRSGKAKFARHAMALGNTRGGFIVVGVGEDEAGRPVLRTGLNEAQAKSFDPTDVGSFINSHADPAIDLDVERPVVDGKQYVVFVVRRFATLPHVCSRSSERELQQGAFYIRTNDASSRVAFRASELHGLVQRAMRNQREVLGRMLRGVLYENSQYMEPESDSRSRFREQVLHSRNFRASRPHGNARVALEVVAYPERFDEKRFGLSEIRAAVENSRLPVPTQPFVVVGSDRETYSTNVSLRSCIAKTGQTWQAFRSGLFHFAQPVPRSGRDLSYDSMEIYAAEIVHFLSSFYAELGLQDELVRIKLSLSDVENLGMKQPDRPGDAKAARGVCRIPKIEVALERSAADLVSGTTNHAARLMRELADRFNLPFGSHGDLEGRIAKYLNVEE
jgi:hypothetical protein